MAIKDLDKWMEGKEHKKLLKKLNNKLVIARLSVHSRSSYLRNMNFLFNSLPDIDFENLTEDDVEEILVKISSSYSNDKTVANYYISFRKWLTISKQEEFLPIVQVPKVKQNYENKEVITLKELDALIETCKHPRDAAIISLLWDSGCRIGELCSCQVKHVQFDENGARITIPESKTYERTLRVVFASSYLRVWLNSHIWKDNPDAPLFYSFKAKDGQMKALSDEGARRQIKIIGQKAGLQKAIHPHLFRHSRASHIAENNIMSEMQMKRQFGWTDSSSMAAIYVHLADDSHEKAILKASGIEIDEPEKQIVKPIKCPRCKELNAHNVDYCIRCTMPLSRKAIEEMEKTKVDNESLMERIEEMERKEQERLESIETIKNSLEVNIKDIVDKVIAENEDRIYTNEDFDAELPMQDLKLKKAIEELINNKKKDKKVINS